VQCQICNKNTATIHLTEISEGARSEMHLCEHCAQEKNMVLAFPSLLSTLVKGGAETRESEAVPATCPGCGLAYAEFKAKGRLGCPQCYTAFAPVLVPLLEKVHSHSTHKGRRPLHQPAAEPAGEPVRESTGAAQPVPAEPAPIDERLRLRLELEAAVDAEDYERAAELRDRIRALEEGDE